MEVTIENAGPYCRVGLYGRLDSAAAADVHDAIVGLAALAHSTVIVDAGHLQSISRAGCRAIFVAAKLLQARCGKMIVLGARDKVKSLLTCAGFDHVIAFAGSADEPESGLAEAMYMAA